MKRILVISTSARVKGNSDSLADAFIKGAVGAGHQVEKIALADKTIRNCTGCLACQQTHHCMIQDDMDEIILKMKQSNVIVFATPVYFYGMSGQMKVLLDRTNPLFEHDYQFQDIYLIASAAEENRKAMDGTIDGLLGWISCFSKTALKGLVYGTGLTSRDDILQHSSMLQEAMEMGSRIL